VAFATLQYLRIGPILACSFAILFVDPGTFQQGRVTSRPANDAR